jgi:hypothetical protein
MSEETHESPSREYDAPEITPSRPLPGGDRLPQVGGSCQCGCDASSGAGAGAGS